MRYHSLVLLGQPISGDSAQIQMLLRRIYSPLQDREEKRDEESEGGKSSEDLPEVAGQ
jgi:hypothetical protein